MNVTTWQHPERRISGWGAGEYVYGPIRDCAGDRFPAFPAELLEQPE